MKSIPLYKQIQMDIKKLISNNVLREGDRVPSEKELAEHYNVSQITSKNALLGLVEEGLLVRIQGKGTFVLSRPEESAALQQLKHIDAEPASGGVIGLILPTMKTKVDQCFVDGIEHWASTAGYDIMLRITRESQEEESRIIESFLSQGVKGMIIFPVENETYNDSILRLSLKRFPFVLIDRFLKEIKTYSVSSDNVNGTCEAIERLLDQQHTHIAFISPEITNTVTDERSQGFELAFMKRKVPVNKHLWCFLSLETISQGHAQDEIAKFLDERPEITAVMTANTELCRYVYKVINAPARRNRKLELVTFDPPGIPGVSYMRQNESEMCRLTVELLLEQINGIYEPRRLVVPVSYVNKDSNG